ncbi:MAG: alpha/beta fold hydrolase [Gammaproteobacteria bacterium]|nr:alpha/beta fold hydrolase [Gammaproteobacteria bacterium]
MRQNRVQPSLIRFKWVAWINNPCQTDNQTTETVKQTVPITLHFQKQGHGEAVIILHGLFGSHENWLSQAKLLARNFTLYTPDLRNHGRSPHSDEINYSLMAADVLHFMDQHDLPSVHLIGHSMGGKVAMQIALNHPERLKSLIVVDIAPKVYPTHHDETIQALAALKIDKIRSRREADATLAQHIPQRDVRLFLLKNLQRDNNGHYQWRMNLKALKKQQHDIAAAPNGGQSYPQACLFIRGSRSDYIQLDDTAQVLRWFPKAQAKTIDNAGHWPHIEKPALFTKLVLDYLKQHSEK